VGKKIKLYPNPKHGACPSVIFASAVFLLSEEAHH
jgi:hypothetical protein